jgi:hypothetical protein
MTIQELDEWITRDDLVSAEEPVDAFVVDGKAHEAGKTPSIKKKRDSQQITVTDEEVSKAFQFLGKVRHGIRKISSFFSRRSHSMSS